MHSHTSTTCLISRYKVHISPSTIVPSWIICNTGGYRNLRSFTPHSRHTPSLALWYGILLRISRPGFNSPFCHGFFSRSTRTSVLKTGTPVAVLPGPWCCRVSAETGWTGVSILWPGDRKFDLQLVCHCGSTCNFPCRSVPWDTLACCWGVKQSTSITTDLPKVSGTVGKCIK